MSRTRLIIKFIAILILAAVAGFIVADKLDLLKIHKQIPFRLGLDILGGAHLVYEGDLSTIAQGDREDAMNAVRNVIERRVNAFGVAEPLVQVAGDNRLIVELAGISDVESAIREIGLTPFLEFREQNPEYVPPTDNQNVDVNSAFIPTGLSGKHLKKSEIVFGQQTNDPQISLEFNDEGARMFADITKRNVGRTVAIFLDGSPISAPVVNQEITSGKAVITGTFNITEAKELAQRLNSGALPVPIKLIAQQSVGPTLGQESLKRSIIAGLIGFLIVALFMIVYYRLPGFFAVLALGIYVVISLMLFKLIGVTLTLAGITGFILSVGMAVDANILVFERLKEELRADRPIHQALDEAFRRAWNAIRDSNVSTLITVFILGYFGSSLIRGFAVTLGIGIFVSMFTALTVTRVVLRLYYNLRNSPIREQI